MPLDVPCDRIARVERAGQREAQTVLLENVRGASPKPGFGTGIRRNGETESGRVVVCGLFGVSDEEVQVVPVEFVQGGVHKNAVCGTTPQPYAPASVEPFAQDRIVHGQRALFPRKEHVVDASRLGMSAQNVPDGRRKLRAEFGESGVVEVRKPSQLGGILSRLAGEALGGGLGQRRAPAPYS